MPKVAITTKHGGHRIPNEVKEWLYENVDEESYVWKKTADEVWRDMDDFTKERADKSNIESRIEVDIERDNPILISAINELEPSGWEIVDVPDDVDWEIHAYDGAEWVAEKHETWPESAGMGPWEQQDQYH